MTNAPLPFVLSIPHGGLATPPEVADRLALDATDLYNECDLWSDRLYDFGGEDKRGVLATAHAPIARAIVDVNRPLDSLDDPDGAVKSQTSYGRPTYFAPLPRGQQVGLISHYWANYHAQVQDALRRSQPQVRLLLDCHNMAQVGPKTYAYADQPRPFICLANLGDDRGEPTAERGPVSCPPLLLYEASQVAATLFADMDLLEPLAERPPVVALNWPFPGGYISRRYSALSNHNRLDATYRAPASIMIEVNRGLFVGNQNARTPIAPPNTERIEAVRSRLYLLAVALAQLVEVHQPL
jgi:N-formylglutamate amidohydrolase